ncbi:MAG: mechanosensitive ion channel family protein [Oscillospiraceae bacterium]|nr:mechanosensitive ion channel family protein [Oscillospiraceae bacterium]
MAEHTNIRKRANTYFLVKVAFNALLIVLGAVLIAVFLRNIQTKAALNKQKENSALALTEAVSTLEENARDAKDLSDVFHDGNQDILTDLKELLTSGLFDSLAAQTRQARSEVFSVIAERSDVVCLFVLDSEGKVVLAPEEKYYRTDLAGQGLLSSEDQKELLKGTRAPDGTVSPVTSDTGEGRICFYSERLSYGGQTFCLVLGADASALEEQTASLKDVSAVLSRAAVGNGGFLFAVDAENGSFLYYENGGEILTGENALDAGLSRAALEDGYAGIETIRGIQYYCVSKTFNGSTVVCAVANTDQIFSNDRHVLFWSILSFVLVMLLCLIYAVIVRNDFVRNAVETKKKIFPGLGGNPVIFDKSIFSKVFPLTIAGVLLILGLSFYTQTLLEITETIDRSKMALEEVSARYQESEESRELIRDYYNNRFLAKAKIISYLFEEDPAVLNETTSRVYSTYDEQGNKQYLTDDEGNPLRSVAGSARLQEICEANDLDSVYIFDQNGRTIATNTPNWFFAISHSEEDQSFEFLQVVDGKKDHLVQEARINDLGEAAQYIGVAFRYYTTVDEDGGTVYASRQDFMSQSEAEGENVKTITPHSSMLQVGLREDLSARLLASTDADFILSTDMLSGGFILLFDNSSDHVCLYSPREASIGMTAAEMGVSPKAFSGDDYYGFTRVNGTPYFVTSSYRDGYYIATAIPKSSMYLFRARIALITALTSLVLILILSGTVTFTTEEEEMLYATMSDEQEKKGLDSAIFNLILPSGKRLSTTKAAARWDNRSIPWSERSPEQKLMMMFSVVFGILLLYVIVTVLAARTIYAEGSVIRYILSGGWDRGLNIFAFSACALVLIFAANIVALFRIPVRIATSLLGTRSATIGHLLLSVVKYGGAIGAFFYCLYLAGMDTKSLLTSVGVLSLVIGLGAQSLIKDIIAGIFIVFEGEFRVGDIVTIDGFRGTVMDIGLRTTKIMGGEGNIKVYNNSEISGVLNMTKEASVAKCYISIEYGQDIDYVEAVLNRDLPSLAEKNPKILDGPTYLGVSNLEDSGVKLLVICRCNETDIWGVMRFMNREILRIFYQNDINVPFPNVTVSQLHTEGRKTMADYQPPEEKKTAQKDEFKRSRTLIVTSEGEDADEALSMTEQFGGDRGLSKKHTLQLRLLAEELFGMMRKIVGDVKARYWLEIAGKKFELHMRSKVEMNEEMRQQLLAASTSGENAASKSLIGRIRVMIAEALMPSRNPGELSPTLLPPDLDEISPLNAAADLEACIWSMESYKEEVKNRMDESDEAKEVWDELEKSIVGKLADEVSVRIIGADVEMIVYKEFRD